MYYFENEEIIHLTEMACLDLGHCSIFWFHFQRDIDNRYIAKIKIDKLERDDFERDNHVLLVENDEEEVEFIITISDERNCDPTQEPGKEQEGFCTDEGGKDDRDRDRIRDEDDRVANKAKEILIDSCLKMSSSLLDLYNPDGDKRSDSKSERDFMDDLEDFFTGMLKKILSRWVIKYPF